MMFKVALLFVVVAAASANNVTFRSCPGQLPPIGVWSDHCTPTRCQLRRNQIFQARAYFSPADTFNQLLVGVSASVFGINFPMNIPVGYEDACDFLGPNESCPVHAGNQHVWLLQFPVEPFLPLVSNLVVRLSAGEGGRTVACAEVDAEVVAS